MKVIETLSPEQISNIMNGNIDGIFNYIFDSSDAFYRYVNDMCRDYYFFRSSDKKIVKRIEKLYSGEYQNVNANEIIGNIIRSKYIDKWNRIYNSIMLEYNIDESINIKHIKNADNNNVRTFNSTELSNGKSETTNNNDYNENLNRDIYGYNSTQAVGDTVNNRKVNEKITNDNTITNKNEKSETNTDNNKLTETNLRTGHELPITTLIEKEISMREKTIFYNIVESDIDKIFTLSIY